MRCSYADSIMSLDIARKAAFLFGVLGKETFRDFAQSLADSLLEAIRRELVDHDELYIYGDTPGKYISAGRLGFF